MLWHVEPPVGVWVFCFAITFVIFLITFSSLDPLWVVAFGEMSLEWVLSLSFSFSSCHSKHSSHCLYGSVLTSFFDLRNCDIGLSSCLVCFWVVWVDLFRLSHWHSWTSVKICFSCYLVHCLLYYIEKIKNIFCACFFFASQELENILHN